MTVAVAFPSTLPNPSLITQVTSDRLKRSSISQGLPQTAPLQRDFGGGESLRWEFTAAQAVIFETWWRRDLLKGCRWFSAYWPRISPLYTVARFNTQPQWRLIGHEYWEVTVESELRGISLPPTRSSLEILLHTNNNLQDVSTFNRQVVNHPYAGSDPTYATGPFGGHSVIGLLSGYFLYTANGDDELVLVDRDWQFDVWLKVYDTGSGAIGGVVFQIGTWSGSYVYSQIQLEVRLVVAAGEVEVQVHYNDVGGSSNVTRIPSWTSGVNTFSVSSSVWKHVGVVCDATSMRTYTHGLLSHEKAGARVHEKPLTDPPGTLDPNGGPFTQQHMFLGASYAGGGPPPGAVGSASFCGEWAELRFITDETIYTGTTITVPTGPFLP